MEEEEAAGARKRKRDGEVVVVLPAAEEAGLIEGGGGYFSWKELGQGLAQAVEREEHDEGIAEESVEEVMRWLEMEISSPGKADGDDGFVTINGNEESCGPSFSAATSTVMASVDTRAGAPPPPTAIPWPWPEPDNYKDDAQEEVDSTSALVSATAADEFDDEEWLVGLLTGGPALEVFGLEVE